MTTLSVALTTFNGERFLAQQLQSLAWQSRKPDELVVVDDGSTDGSFAVLTEFGATAPFCVRVHRNESRIGWRANFMKAAALCQGDLISFCDQDDIWYANKLSTVQGLFQDDAVLLAYHDADLVDANGIIIGRLRAEEHDSAIRLPRTRPTTWSNPLGLTLTFRKRLLALQSYWATSVDPRDTRMPAAHDQWFYDLATNLGTIRYTPERLLAYRQHGANAVGFSNSKTGGAPYGWDRSRDGYIDMLSAFCRALENARADRVKDFGDALEEALVINRAYLHRLRLNRAAHRDIRLSRRLYHMKSLLREQAFSAKTPWNLGKRAFLSALLVGLPIGR